MCRVPNCNEKHAQHFCRVCGNKNANHFSKNCRKGKVLYHGTKFDVLKPIIKDGFYPSTVGNLGQGVYLTTKDEALKIARSKGKQHVVIRVRVNLGKMKYLDRD